MKTHSDKVRMQTILEPELATRIRDLAQRMKFSESAVIAMLLEAAVEDNEGVIRAATSQLGKKLSRALGILGTDRQRYEAVDRELEAIQQQDRERAA